ncbi:MAG: aminotransferase class III-fold pyridoxal phosphate-dependent enzyme [Acidobacteria bacterium]|nr:aminotransferase class III-fold pyridoxal phosphate-dependent enzyme [Acidobacteriota bacterium]
MTGEEIVALSKRHTIFEWAVQGTVDPIPVARAEGIYFWTPEGKRFIDLNSQLMCVNIGHGDTRVIEAMHRQAEALCYVTPGGMATESRARLGAKLAEITPGDINVFFFTNGGAESIENAIKIARAFTGRPKIVSRYRSYHGATAAALAATGEPRAWMQPPMPGFVHVVDWYHGVQREEDSADDALQRLEEVIQLEGPPTIAAIMLESVTGTNGILIPPDGYMQGVRALCDRYGILMIADEVMSGFGRTGKWFAIEHWGVVPDLMTMAKGLTSAYVPLGAVGMRQAIADAFRDKPFPGGLTYSSHAVACAAALATLAVYEEDRLIDRARERGVLMRRLLEDLAARHPSVGAVRSIGLFGLIELVRNRRTREPMAPFGGTSPEMAALGTFFRQEGLFTFVRWNSFFTNPPLCISEAELREAFAIIDRGVTITDKAVET